MKRRDKDIRWSKLETGLPRPVAKKRFNPPQPDDQPHPDAVMSADQAARQDSTSGTATGKVAGRLVGPAMPGRVGFPLAGLRVTLTIDPAQMLRAPRATPPVLVLPDPINCTTDATGLLLDEHGNPGVELIGTDAPRNRARRRPMAVACDDHRARHRQADLVDVRATRRHRRGPQHRPACRAAIPGQLRAFGFP